MPQPSKSGRKKNQEEETRTRRHPSTSRDSLVISNNEDTPPRTFSKSKSGRKKNQEEESRTRRHRSISRDSLVTDNEDTPPRTITRAGLAGKSTKRKQLGLPKRMKLVGLVTALHPVIVWHHQTTTHWHQPPASLTGRRIKRREHGLVVVPHTMLVVCWDLPPVRTLCPPLASLFTNRTERMGPVTSKQTWLSRIWPTYQIQTLKNKPLRKTLHLLS
jgi:hypothetical protein